MKISVDRKEFVEALSAASRCLEKGNAHSILKMFRLSFEPNTLTVVATDLDKSVRIEMEAVCDVDLDICVDGKALTSIVERLGGERIDLSFNDKNLIIERDSGDIKLRTVDPEQYPIIALGKDFKIGFESVEFFELCRSVLLGTSDDRSDYTNVSRIAELSIERNLIEGKFRCIATDQHRLAIINGLCDTEEKEPLVVQLPVMALRTLLTAKNTQGKVRIGEDAHHIFVAVGEKKDFSFRKFGTKFPNIAAYLEKMKFDKVVKLTAENLRESLELVGQVVSPLSQRVGFNLNGDLTLSAQTAEVGEIEDSIEAEIDFEPFTVGFNIHYILPIIREMSGEIDLCFAKDERKQKNEKGEEYIYSTAYPMRVTYFRNNVTSSFDVQSLTN